MYSRIGYPCEHLANENNKDLMSPMYSTGIGLVLKGFEAGNSMRIVKKEEKSKNPRMRAVLQKSSRQYERPFCG